MNTYMQIVNTRWRLSPYGKIKHKIASFSFLSVSQHSRVDANRRMELGFFFYRKYIWLIFLWTSSTSQLRCSSHTRWSCKCGTFLERGMNMLSNNTPISANNEVPSDKQCSTFYLFVFFVCLCVTLFD